MISLIRPLPLTIAAIALLAGVKTIDLAKTVGIGSPARASTTEAPKPSPARTPDPKPDPKPEAPKPAADGAKPPITAPAQPPTPTEAAAECDTVTEAERSTLQDLRGRRKLLDERASRLDEREALLGAAEQRLTERVQQLTALQTKLEALDKQRKERDDANWNGLVKTYEAMKPHDAAVIFNDLDNTILVQVLDRMKEAKAASILAAMTPERARAATIQLAKYREQVSAAPRITASAAGK